MRRVGVAIFTILLSAGFLCCGNASATAGYDKLLEDLNGGDTLNIKMDTPKTNNDYFALEAYIQNKYHMSLSAEWNLNTNLPNYETLKIFNNTCVDTEYFDDYYQQMGHTSTCEENESKNVNINFIGSDKTISSKVDSLMDRLSAHELTADDYTDSSTARRKGFNIYDMNFLNYVVSGFRPYEVHELNQAYITPEDDMLIQNSSINFSQEYKNELENSNLQIVFRPGMGDGGYFFIESYGEAAVINNESIYGSVNVGSFISKIIYIPSSTNETTEAYIDAANTRIRNYFKGTKYENSFTIRYAGKASDNLDDYMVEVEEGIFDTDIDDYFVLTFNGIEYEILIRKDDTKMIEPKFATKDIGTDIEIHSDDTTIPLDSVIEAEQIDTKDRADKIKLIGLTGAEIYDLSIYSFGAGIQTSKGNFMVYIPVSPALNGKNLTAYWVSDDGKIEEHPVTIQNGFAIFETNHFSEYILGTSDGGNPQTLDMIQVSIITFASCGVILLASLKRSSLRR